MKVTCFAAIAFCAVLALAIADDRFNGDDSNGFASSVSYSVGAPFSVSSGHGSGYGSSGHGSGYGSSGHGSGYGSSGYGSGYGSSGYGSGYGSSGYGSGYGGISSGLGMKGGAHYVPLPIPAGQSSGSGIGSFLPLLAIIGLLPILLNLFNTGATQDQIILVNSTLTG